LADDDLERVRKAEMQRGRRHPLDVEAAEERRRHLAALREIVKNGSVDELKEAMRAFGVLEDSPEWREALRIWSAERAL